MSKHEDEVRVQMGLKPKNPLPKPQTSQWVQEMSDSEELQRIITRPILQQLEEKRRERVENMIREQMGLKSKRVRA